VSTKASTHAGRRRAAARTARGAPSSPAAKPQAPPRAKAAAPPRPKAPPKRARPKRSAAKAPKRSVRPKAPKRPVPKLRRVAPKAAKPTRGRLGSLRRRATVALVIAAALAVAYFAWFRDSSLVAVDDVTVDGLAGGSSNPAAAALVTAAKDMTTLHIDQSRLDEAASRFPEIAAVSADASFPHGLTLHITQRPPAMIAHDGGRTVPVAADGTVLTGGDVPKSAKLPSLPVDHIPAIGRLSGTSLDEALVLGAAPAPLRREIIGISSSQSHGIAVKLHGGIELRFGTSGAAADKWAAAAAVLADKRLTTLTYIDVQVPKRPAVG
jgi:cell division septal protein FtsQ